jgi:hypothetical protein
MEMLTCQVKEATPTAAPDAFCTQCAPCTSPPPLVSSQVHKARLLDGRQVAVKVQYPGLRGAANADLTTLSLLSAAAAAMFPNFRLSWLYDELRLKLTEELGGSTGCHRGERCCSASVMWSRDRRFVAADGWFSWLYESRG